MGALKTFLTFEQFERLEDSPFKQELIHGELIELPPPELKHQRISRRIFKPLDAALEQAQARGDAIRLGETCYETGCKFPDDTYLTPDVSVTHAEQPEGKYLEGSPAIVIEILSPSNTAKLMDAKMKIYFEFGALEVWRVNHKKRSFAIYTPPDGCRVIPEDGVVTTPLVPGFSLRVADVFGA